MPFETILFEIAEGVATLTLNRPDKLNAFTGAMHIELREALRRVREDSSASALLITGAGRGFALTKQALIASPRNSLEQQLAFEAPLQREAGRSADFREGVQAFLDQRPARFTGN